MNVLYCSKNESFYNGLTGNSVTVDSISKCLRQLAQNDFDIVVYEKDDVRLTQQSLTKLLKNFPSQKIIGVYGQVRKPEISAQLSNGLSGVIAKDEVTSIYNDVFDIVHFGGVYISKKVRQMSIEESGENAENTEQNYEAEASNEDQGYRMFWKNGADKLTPRQLEIVMHLLEGLSNRDIANALSISEGTVKIHLNTIFKKLNISNRNQIFRYVDNFQDFRMREVM